MSMPLRALLPTILACAACGGAGRSVAGSPAADAILVDVDEAGVGLEGHDPVAYATEGRPVPGEAARASSHGGATYWFASEESRKAFDAEPARYSPRYGGYCAYAASQNRLSAADPASFEIVEGQLLMFTNAAFKEQFDGDRAGFMAKADRNWPGLVARHGKPR